MLRKFIFRSEEDGREVTLPVTPAAYSIPGSLRVETVNVYGAGEYAVPTEPRAENWTLPCLFPSSDRSYCVAYAEAWGLLSWFQAQRDQRSRLRFIVSDTAVNVPVYVTGVEYGEEDGTNDLQVVLSIQQRITLAAPTVQRSATAAAAARPAAAPRSTETTYTVQAGDTLWGIARRFYGDGSLYTKIAAYNGLKNPNLIRVGQVLKIPDAKTLSAVAASAPKSAAKTSAKVQTHTVTMIIRGFASKARVTYHYLNGNRGVDGAVTNGMKLTVPANTTLRLRWTVDSAYTCGEMSLDDKPHAIQGSACSFLVNSDKRCSLTIKKKSKR